MDTEPEAQPIRAMPFDPKAEWIPFLPPPGVYQYAYDHRVDVTEDMLAAMIRHFQLGIYGYLAIFAQEHTRYLGTITGLRRSADRGIEARPVWTVVGAHFLTSSNGMVRCGGTWCESWFDPGTGNRIGPLAMGMIVERDE